jgi:DNA primase
VGIFPSAFIDQLRTQVDIVQVVQDHVSLKKAGTSYKGLCPFHSEKTPSFHVNRDKGFFHCFGCGVGGDVFKFLELQERMAFPEAVRYLAGRLGLEVPDTVAGDDRRADAADREALLKMHETAQAYFSEMLRAPAGSRARQQLRERGVSNDTVQRLGLGFAPNGRDELWTRLTAQGFRPALVLQSGLVVQRDDGQVVDRFRNRLMVPICRDSGSTVAFGGRAMNVDQVPKYLNSPETAIYTKGRTLYGLNLTKGEIRRLGYAVIVEGYFDFAQLVQTSIGPVVASCGTALTAPQAQLLRRFTSKVILSFDPDAAGQVAAARSCELLVSEGFDVNVAVLPHGEDPDALVRGRGRQAYLDLLKGSRPYLEYLLDRTAAQHDLQNDEGRRQFLAAMLAVAARIPDAAARDQFGDRLAHKARITETVVRDEIRKAAVSRQTTLTARELPAFGQVKQAERGLIWALLNEPERGLLALQELEDADLQGLASRGVLETAKSLAEGAVSTIPSALLERLSTLEAQLVTGIATEPVAPAPAIECGKALKRLRYERERAAVQREIDRLQGLGADQHDTEIDVLWQRKKDLLQRIEALI